MRSALAVLLGTALLAGQSPEGWPAYGHDPGGARFSPLRKINTTNVQKLTRAWVYHTGEFPPAPSNAALGQRRIAFETTPLVIGDVLYFSTPASRVIALDSATGRELWKFDPWAAEAKPLQYRANRGVSYWPGDRQNSARILAGTADGRLLALNAATGQLIPGFGNEGVVDLRKGVADAFPKDIYGVTSPPAIYKNLVITGAEVPESPNLGPSGDIRAFDVRDGKLVWQFHTVPQPGEPGHETWEGDSWKNRTGVNVWSGLTVDTQLGIVFLPIGAPSYDYYGGDRKGANLFGNCLVALDAATGKVRWYFQLVHHDIWDYDPPAPPALITVQGKPAVVQVTKMGLVFIFDRRTGKPLFPIEERPFPQSDVPGEATWPTQPIPVKPPPISRATITRDDLTQVPDEAKQYCADLFSKLIFQGRYTPWHTKPTLLLPGTLGGATWSGVSFDPSLGLLFVNTNETGAVGQLEPQPEGSPLRYQRVSPNGLPARFWNSSLWPCIRPPWGTLNAINVNTGDIAWRVPLGVTPELEKTGIRKTGAPNLGGSIATATGLVFIAATSDSMVRAFEGKTGTELWSAELDASGYATPITYETKRGRQLVVIAAGGGGFFSDKTSDALIAFGLPE